LALQIETLLDDIQQNVYQKAFNFRQANTTKVDTYEAFKEVLDGKGGFILAHWDGTSQTEEKIKEETKATIRCIPMNAEPEEGKCIYSGKPSGKRVIFARAY
jgi:prolyl-tRNA synthetase